MASPKPPMQETEAQRTSRALAEASNEAEERQADETVPGGKYLVGGRMVDGKLVDAELVDAEGKPFKDKKDE